MSRQSWVYRNGPQGVEVYEKGTEPPSDSQARVPIVGDLHYANTVGPSGEDLSTRTKHREFMKRTGLTTADDFKDTWAKAAVQRNKFLTTGDPGNKQRRAAIERAVHEVGNRRR